MWKNEFVFKSNKFRQIILLHVDDGIFNSPRSVATKIFSNKWKKFRESKYLNEKEKMI